MREIDRYVMPRLLGIAAIVVTLLAFYGFAVSKGWAATPDKPQVAAMWCAWNDFSSHSLAKCAPTRAACEKNSKKNKWGDCTSWLS